MARFKVVLIEHGYATTKYERDIIEAAGGEFVDADALPLARALALCEEADGILCRRIEVSRAMLEKFRRCRILVRYGVGTDNVDVDAATDLKIIVGHVPSYCRDEVSAHAIALLLAAARRLVWTHRKLEAGGWDVRRGESVHRLAGRTLGLVGFGGIGQTVARRLAGWGLRLLAADPFVEPARAAELGVELVDFETVCRSSDYISLHCPLLSETYHLVDRRALSLMKPEACLVNTARGAIVDPGALVEALDAGRPACAALDVFEEEPLPPGSPLRRHERVIVTDHTAWYSEESQVELQRTAAEEIVRVCTGGLPRSLANPHVLERLGRWDEWEPGENVRWQLKRLAALRRS